MLQGTAKAIDFIGRIISVSTFLKLGSSHPNWVADHLTNWLLGKNLFRKGGLEMDQWYLVVKVQNSVQETLGGDLRIVGAATDWSQAVITSVLTEHRVERQLY